MYPEQCCRNHPCQGQQHRQSPHRCSGWKLALLLQLSAHDLVTTPHLLMRCSFIKILESYCCVASRIPVNGQFKGLKSSFL